MNVTIPLLPQYAFLAWRRAASLEAFFLCPTLTDACFMSGTVSQSRGQDSFRNYSAPFAYLQLSVYFGFNSDGFYD